MEKKKEIIVIVCENEAFFKRITEIYKHDVRGEFDSAMTYMGRFKAEKRPEIVEKLMEIN